MFLGESSISRKNNSKNLPPLPPKDEFQVLLNRRSFDRISNRSFVQAHSSQTIGLSVVRQSSKTYSPKVKLSVNIALIVHCLL